GGAAPGRRHQLRAVAGHPHPRRHARAGPGRADPDRDRAHQRPDRQRRGGGSVRRGARLRHRGKVRRPVEPGRLHRPAMDHGPGAGPGLPVLSGMRTQVAIVGAGPAGLLLGHLLHLHGIDSVVLERRSRAYVERRIRAGVLEHGTVELLRAVGLAGRLDRQGMVHHGLELLFDGTGHRIDLSGLAGRPITVYGQHELVKDLIAARLETGRELLFEAPATELADLDTKTPVVRFTHRGRARELRAEVVAGCDGFHGVSRGACPATSYTREYPYAWLGVLAQAPPSSAELIYAHHERGFALHSMR